MKEGIILGMAAGVLIGGIIVGTSKKAQQMVNRVNKALEQQEKTRIAVAQESLQRLARLK